MTRQERLHKIFEKINKSANNYMVFAFMTDEEVESAYYEILKIK